MESRRWAVGVLAAALALVACSEEAPAPMRPLVPERRVDQFLRSRSSGALAMSRDDRTLFVAEADTGAVLVVDVLTLAVRATVAACAEPVQVVLGDDNLLWVPCRRDRAVAVVDPVEARVVARLPTPPEPTALAFAEGGHAYAVVATRTGATLEVFDRMTREHVRSIAVGPDPVQVHPSGENGALVFHGVSGDVSVVDLEAGVVTSRFSLTEPTRPGREARIAEQPGVPVRLPGTDTLFVPHQLAKAEATPTDTPDAYLGRTLHMPVVGYGLARIDLAARALLSAEGTCFGCSNDFGGLDSRVPPAAQPARFVPIAGGAASVTDGLGRYLYVANRLSGNVAPFPTAYEKQGIFPVFVGAGASGLAMPSSDDRVYAWAQFDHRLSVLYPQSLLPPPIEPQRAIAPEQLVDVGLSAVLLPDPLPARLSLGRKLFHAAYDRQMTDPSDGGIACASCHPDGRHDGRTWQFAEGPRNTPLLAGRHLAETPPWHWDGTFADVMAFKTQVEQRMGGRPDDASHGRKPLGRAEFEAIIEWLDSQPPPDRPHAVDPAAAERGRSLFEGRAACATCHPAPLYTDLQFHDVGTLVTANPHPGGHPDTFPRGIDTPTLLHVWAAPPYLHDGSAPTLEARLADNPGDRHGATSHLTPEERADLVAFLMSL
jgi:DNA-binding beta-propeller fold protein YncE